MQQGYIFFLIQYHIQHFCIHPLEMGNNSADQLFLTKYSFKSHNNS